MASPRRKWLWCALALLVTPLLLEGVVRVRAHVKYGSQNDVFDCYERDPETGYRVPIPGLVMNLAKQALIEIDSRGFRSPEVAVPKPANGLRLAFLGASTTFCVEVADNTRTWPAQVTRKLAEAYPELEVDHLNAAVNAYGLAESHERLTRHVQPLEPDVVVVYHATRDLSRDTLPLAREAGAMEPLRKDWLEERSLLWKQIKVNLHYRRTSREGRSAVPRVELDPAALADGFEGRLRALVRTAREQSQVVVLLTFATLARRDQEPEVMLANLTHAFTFTPYLTPEQLFDAYDAYNRAIRTVAREEGCVLVELPDHLPGTREYFHDSVHFTDTGCERVAETVGDALLAAPSFLELVESREPK